MNKISVLWPLPPWKGISQYVKWFVKALGSNTSVQVLDFAIMYPARIYPGGDPKQAWVSIPQYPGVTSEQLLTWRNPFSWIRAGLKIEWEVLHMQYWIWFLSPIYITVWCIARYIKKIPIIITVHNAKPHETKRNKLKLNKHFLFTLADNAVSYIKIYLDKFVYMTADRLIVHSETNKQQLENIIWTTKEIAIFPHGIIMPEVEKIDKQQAREELQIWIDKQVLLFFGVIRPYKGLHIALEALSLLTKENPQYHLIIAGKCRGERQEYDDKISDLVLQDHITRVAGFLDDDQLAQVFSASDIMVLPYTHFDAQSWVVALWLGYELPIVVSRLWWLTDIIDDEKYICEVNNALSLHDQVVWLEGQDTQWYIVSKQKKFSRDTIISEMLLTYYHR